MFPSSDFVELNFVKNLFNIPAIFSHWQILLSTVLDIDSVSLDDFVLPNLFFFWVKFSMFLLPTRRDSLVRLLLIRNKFYPVKI